MKTFCAECMKETESTLYAEVRECKACGKMWECPGNPEMTALNMRIAELEAERDKYKAALKAIGIGMLMPDEFAKAALDGRWNPIFEKGGE